MKRVIFIVFAITLGLLISASAFGQKKPKHNMTEKEAIEKDHIDFNKEILYFRIHAMIEIDGHVFNNDTCKCPILFMANLDGVTIIDTCYNIKYKHRKCSKLDCSIIHLSKDAPVVPNNTLPDHRMFFNAPYTSPSHTYDNLNLYVH